MSRCDFKIVLLGSEHVGKTSLVIRFVNSRFNSGTPYQNVNNLSCWWGSDQFQADGASARRDFLHHPLMGGNQTHVTHLLIQMCRFPHDVFLHRKSIGYSGSNVHKTIGAAFCAKAMHSDGKDFNIGIWDTAGSERYEAMTRMYYRGAHAAIICYEPGSALSWLRLRHWLTELRTVEEDCKVYLCGTKKDLLDSGASTREVPEDTVATYSQGLFGHFLTSSKTGENIDELFQKIVDDCAADQRVMKDVEEQRLQLVKEEMAYKEKHRDYCLC